MALFPSLRSKQTAEGRRLDRWLRFSGPVQRRYDKEHAAERVRALRSAIVAALILYNVYNVTGALLQPDAIVLAIGVRIGLVSLPSLGLYWLIGRTSPAWTERMVLVGVSYAYLLTLFLFWWPSSPTGLFTFSELFLVVVYANMLLALRFFNAAIFTGLAFATTIVALQTKGGMAPALELAFIVQLATACIFSLYANHRMEHQRCYDFLKTLGASLRAEYAEIDRRRFEDMSRTDSLTELPNRRFLEEQLGSWFRLGERISILMIDIDYFKLYNDTLGHPAGDLCLSQIAKLLSRLCDSPDRFCARFGGEEFIVLLRGANEFQSAQFAERLLSAVRALEIPHPTRSDGADIVTFSIGVDCHEDRPEKTARNTFEGADQALYVAKQQGRNCFAMSPAEQVRTLHAA